MDADVKLPENLYDYYKRNRTLFGERINWVQKAAFGFGLLVCSIMVLFPDVISERVWIVRIIAGIGIMGFWLGVVETSKNYFNKKTGGVIKPLAVKKFDMNRNDEEDILEAFYNKDFDKLSVLTEGKDRPIELYIHEDTKGEFFYCQLMKYSSPTDFRPLTDVIVLKGALYEKYKSVIRGLCPVK